MGTGREGKRSLDLNNVSARYLWDIPRAVLERAVQISLALRRGCWSDMFPLPTPQQPPPPHPKHQRAGGSLDEKLCRGLGKGTARVKKATEKFFESSCFEQVCKSE